MYRTYLVVGLTVFGLGVFLGQRLATKQAGTSDVEVVKDTKTNDIVTVTHEIVHTDGTKETVTEITDKTKTTDLTKKTQTTIAATPAPNWFLQGTVESKGLVEPPIYGAIVNRRILGPLFLGIGAKTDRTVALTIGAEF